MTKASCKLIYALKNGKREMKVELIMAYEEERKMKSKNNEAVFISYSWESKEHKDWVMKLSERLNQNGVKTIIDQKDLMLGDSVTQFMEQSISESEYVLIICTPTYKDKADKRKGGVGFEESIITGEVYYTGKQRKYITVLASGTWETSIPTWAKGKCGVDLSSRPYDEEEFEKLLETIKFKSNIQLT